MQHVHVRGTRMIRATTVAAMILLSAAAAAQTGAAQTRAAQTGAAQTAGEIGEAPEAGGSPTQIPEIRAGTDPMKRQPDPAAGTPAARTPSDPAADNRNANCRVRRADTDTGFVVVCEHAD